MSGLACTPRPRPVMAMTPAGSSTCLVRAAALLALATGLRVGLRFWIGTGANTGLERLVILGGGLLMLICTGLAAGQAALGLLAIIRGRNEP